MLAKRVKRLTTSLLLATMTAGLLPTANVVAEQENSQTAIIEEIVQEQEAETEIEAEEVTEETKEEITEETKEEVKEETKEAEAEEIVEAKTLAEAEAQPTNIVIEGTTSKEKAESIVSQMTFTEKLGQVMALDIRTWGGSNHMELKPGAAAMLRDYALGSVCLFAENFNSNDAVSNADKIAQATTLTNAIQAAGTQSRFGIPLLISIDQEGGIVVRLQKLGTTMTGNMALGSTHSPELAYKTGKVIGEEVGAIGCNVNFAPTLDVNLNPDNPVIGARSLGSDPLLVGRLGSQYIKGIQDAGVIATAKHFPGHGNTATDSHYALPLVPGTKAELLNRDLVPFKQAIAEGVDMIMTGHLMVLGLDNSTLVGTKSGTTMTTPATLSKPILTDLLRNELGFDGIIVTDAMNMAAISSNFHPADAVELAILAGVDMPLMPVVPNKDEDVVNVIKKLYDDLEAKANANSTLMNRIEESAARVIKYKIDKGIYDPSKTGTEQPCFDSTLEQKITNAQAILRSAEHLAVEKEVSDASIVLAENKVINGKPVLPFELKEDTKVFAIVPTSTGTALVTTYQAMVDKAIKNAINNAGLTDKVTVETVTYSATDGSFTQAHKDAIDAADYVIIGSEISTGATRDPKLSGLPRNNIAIWSYIQSKGYGSKTAGMSLGLPYELSYLEYCSALVNATSRSRVATVRNYDSAAEVIFGQLVPTGKFPVDVPNQNPDSPVEFIRMVGDGLTYNNVTSASLTVDSKKARVGSEVDVLVKLENNTGASGLRFVLDFDKEVLEPVSFEALGILADEGNIESNMKDSNVDLKNINSLTFVWANNENVIGEDGAVSIKFKVKKRAANGNTALTISSIDLTNDEPKTIAITPVNGFIQTTNPYGDITEDGVVDNADLVLLMQYLANWKITLTPSQLDAAANIIADGKVDVKDLVKLLQHLGGWKSAEVLGLEY